MFIYSVYYKLIICIVHFIKLNILYKYYNITLNCNNL